MATSPAEILRKTKKADKKDWKDSDKKDWKKDDDKSEKKAPRRNAMLDFIAKNKKAATK